MGESISPEWVNYFAYNIVNCKAVEVELLKEIPTELTIDWQYILQ